MTIDWITVSAQIINFLLLVWLLKHFLYQPVIRAMNQREQRIAERLDQAQEREQQAEERIQQYQDQLRQLQQQRSEILAAAKQEAGEQKKTLLEAARDDVSAQRNNWRRQANIEKEEFLGSLRQQSMHACQAIARKALGDLANAELEDQVCRTFLDRFTSLDKAALKTLASTDEPVRIASAFELESAMRDRLTRVIGNSLGQGVTVEYTRSPDLLCGIELVRGSQRLSWNLADYLQDLDTRIKTAFSAIRDSAEEKASAGQWLQGDEEGP
jgi:F-type H+-transporting ATPase subunit b